MAQMKPILESVAEQLKEIKQIKREMRMERAKAVWKYVVENWRAMAYGAVLMLILTSL